MKGERGGIVISISTLQLTRSGKYSCFLSRTVKRVSSESVGWHKGHKSLAWEVEVLA